MHLPVGVTVRLVLLEGGYTLEGVTARSGQWGVHRLEKVTVWDRDTPTQLQGSLDIKKSHVLFVQIEPPGTE